VEYEEHSSPSIYVRFPIVGDIGKAEPRPRGKRAAGVLCAARPAQTRAAFAISPWTPWTLPANLAVVANPELDYVAIPRDGEYLIVAAGLAESFLAATGIAAPKETWIEIPRAGLRTLEGTTYTPPFPRPNADAKK